MLGCLLSRDLKYLPGHRPHVQGGIIRCHIFHHYCENHIKEQFEFYVDGQLLYPS